MAGRVVVSTLNDDTGVLATQNGMTGIAKAWVNFNGTNGSIRDSFNISSVTRNATGDYTVTFTTNMPNANYDVNGNTSYGSVRACIVSLFMQTGGGFVAPTTSSFRFMTLDSANLAQDLTYVCISVFSS